MDIPLFETLNLLHIATLFVLVYINLRSRAILSESVPERFYVVVRSFLRQYFSFVLRLILYSVFTLATSHVVAIFMSLTNYTYGSNTQSLSVVRSKSSDNADWSHVISHVLILKEVKVINYWRFCIYTCLRIMYMYNGRVKYVLWQAHNISQWGGDQSGLESRKGRRGYA